jgi:uncharacterized protein YbaR (Trm112 family)
MQCPKCKHDLNMDVVDDQDNQIATAIIDCPKCHLTVSIVWPEGPEKQAIIIPGRLLLIAK